MSNLKSNYSLASRLEVFYTGGSVRLSTKDSSRTACACLDEVKVIDNATGGVVHTISGDTEPVTSLAWGPKNESIIVASRSLQLRIFSLETGRPIKILRGHKAPVADMAVDSTETLLATASADKSVRVWDIDGGYCTHSFTGHQGVVTSCIFHPSQLLLITGGDDSQIKIWDLVSKSCISTLKAHFSTVTCLAISDDGWTLLSGGRDGIVVAWDLKNYSKLSTVPVYEAVESIVSLPSLCKSYLKAATEKTHIFATGGEKGVVKIWRSDTASCVSKELPGMPLPSSTGSIVELRLSVNSKSGFDLLAGTQDCRLLFINLSKLNIGLHKHVIGNNDEITDLRFLPARAGEPRYLAASTNGEQIHTYEAETLSCADTLTGHTEAVLALDVIDKNGHTLLASGSKDTTVRLWSINRGMGTCIATGTGHVGAVTALSFSSYRSDKIFLVSGGADKLLRSWDISNLKDGPESEQSLPATAAIPAHDKEINAVAISPNNALVASASQDKTIKIWKTPDLIPHSTLRGHKRGVWAINFSPVDQALISASGDKTIKLWNINDGTCLRTFEGHVSSVLRVGFLSLGTQLLSSGADGLLKLWNVRTSEAIATFDAHEDKVWALSIGDSDGNNIASGGADGSIALWRDCTEADRVAAAEEAENIALKEQDLENVLYLGKWKEAAQLAIGMGRPGKLLTVLQKALENNTETAFGILSQVAESLDEQQIKLSLEYCREWNTNSKNCACSQAYLNALLNVHSKEKIVAIPGCEALLDGIKAYTLRHISRVDRLIRSSFIIDYILSSMGALMPVVENSSEPGSKSKLSELPPNKLQEETRKTKRRKRNQ